MQPADNLTPDDILENEIEQARLFWHLHPTTPNWDRLVSLIKQRSPEQVKKMEEEKGLNGKNSHNKA